MDQNNNRRRILARAGAITFATTLGLQFLSACSSAPLEDVETESSAIINGTPVTTDNIGAVYLSVGCSGTMLSDRWALTAHHCVTNEGVITGGTAINPATLSVTALNGASAGASQIYLAPNGMDAALVYLNGSITNADGRPYANPLYLGTMASLLHKQLFCEGWGKNTETGGEGTLRSATMVVDELNADWRAYKFVPNASGQLPWFYDSGSSCFIQVDGVWRVTGVQSTANSPGAPAFVWQGATEGFRDWAEGVMGNAATMFVDANYFGGAQALLPGGPNGGSYDYQQLTVGNDAISSLTVPAQWTVNLYKDGGFTNFLTLYTANTPAVSSSVNDQASGAVVFGGVRLFKDINLGMFAGIYDRAGGYPFPPSLTNTVSSLTVPAGWRVKFFDNGDFTGPVAIFGEGTHSFVGWSFNDRASSMIVEEPVAVYADADYKGAVARLLPGGYDVEALGLAEDTISSIFVPVGMQIEVFENAHFTGTHSVLTASRASLPVLNDKISSFIVSRR